MRYFSTLSALPSVVRMPLAFVKQKIKYLFFVEGIFYQQNLKKNSLTLFLCLFAAPCLCGAERNMTSSCCMSSFLLILVLLLLKTIMITKKAK